MPMLQSPRPSISILVKNDHNNGGRGGKKAPPWLSVLGMGGMREEDVVFCSVQLSLSAQATDQQ